MSVHLILVLGSPNDDDGNLSMIARERLDAAYAEYQRTPGARVLLTGAFGPHFNRSTRPHVEYARRYLVDLGLPESSFTACALSANTHEDAELSYPIVSSLGAREVTVVTSDFHVERAKSVFEPVFVGCSLLWVSAKHRGTPEEVARLEEHERSRRLPMRIELDDPACPDVRALLEEHLRNMHELSPPESVHALDTSGLQGPDITFWSVREGATLLGCGALRELDPEHGEIKSMRTPQSLRRRGAGRAILAYMLDEARARGYKRVSLETGSAEAFVPARTLYESVGFAYCGPFADYELDPNSVFMMLLL